MSAAIGKCLESCWAKLPEISEGRRNTLSFLPVTGTVIFVVDLVKYKFGKFVDQKQPEAEANGVATDDVKSNDKKAIKILPLTGIAVHGLESTLLTLIVGCAVGIFALKSAVIGSGLSIAVFLVVGIVDYNKNNPKAGDKSADKKVN